jgi:O-antigen/teichoic acid export membrane protein
VIHLTAGASVLRVAMPAVSMVVLARIFTPDRIAPLGTYVMVTAIPLSVASLRLDDAIAIARSPRHGRAISALAVRALAAMVAVTAAGLGIVLATGVLPEFGQGTWFIAAAHVAAFGAWRLGCAWLLREHRMKRWMLADTAGPILLAVAQVTIGWLTGSVQAVLWGFPVSYALACLWVRGAAPAGTWSLARSRSLVRRGWRLASRFPRFLVPYTALGTVRDRVIIGALRDLSPTAVGLFYQSERIALLPGTVVTGALRPITQVVGGRETRDRLAAMVERITVRVCPVAGLGAGAACAFAEPIVVLLFGGEYRGASQYLVALAPAGLVMACSNWLDRLFHLSGNQRSALVAEAAGSTVVIAVVIAATALIGDGVTVAWAYGTSFAAYQVAWWWLALRRGIGRTRSLGVGLALMLVGFAGGYAAGLALRSFEPVSRILP